MTVGTGFRQAYTNEQRAKMSGRLDEILAQAERTGDHIWTALVVYRIDPANPMMILDGENLVEGPLVGCYRCESPYSAWINHRRCKGGPDDQ